MTEQPTAAGVLTAAIGPSIGYHISQARAGGYVVVVDGAIHAARSTLAEAIAVMGKVAADQYGEAAAPPEQARDATMALPPTPRQEEERDAAAMAERFVRPPELHERSDVPAAIARRIRATAGAVAIALMVTISAMKGA